MIIARADVRDVCFVHWPVDPAPLAERLSDALAPATRDGTAWLSMLCQRTLAGLRGPSVRFGFPQVTLRTYVGPDAGGVGDGESTDVGVHFLRVQGGSRLATWGARLLYDVPYHHASIRHEASADETGGASVRTECRDAAGRSLVDGRFAAESAPAPVADDALVEWLTERYRYYLADGRWGAIDHEPWHVAPASATVAADELRDAAAVPAPVDDPIVRYSPGTDIALTRRPRLTW